MYWRIAPTIAATLIAGMGPTLTHAENSGGDAGQLAFNNHCRECHTDEKDDNRLGPSLYGVVGRKAATEPNYGGYSEALKQSGIVWDEASLDKFIASPDDFLPNNNMQPPYPGLADAKQRQLVLAFLKSDAMMGAGKAVSPPK